MTIWVPADMTPTPVMILLTQFLHVGSGAYTSMPASRKLSWIRYPEIMGRQTLAISA